MLPVMPPIKPMLAKAAPAIPVGMHYEPKWDGFRGIIFRDGDEVVIGSRSEKQLTRYFPEIVEAVRRHWPERCVVDGEIVIVSPDRRKLEWETLSARIHPAESRILKLSQQTPASFVAFDLLALSDRNLMSQPLAERRALLEEFIGTHAPSLYVTPKTDDRDLAQHWFAEWEGAGLDGVVAKDPQGHYLPDKRAMTKVKHLRTVDCVVAGYRLHRQETDAVGSLLLGLWNGDELGHVGVVGSLPMQLRRDIFEAVQPLVTDSADHPWLAPSEGRTPRTGEKSRWSGGKSFDFVPLEPELVLEVTYDYLEGSRFRHTAQYSRWRPDRDPKSCTFEQLEVPIAFDLAEVLPPA